MEYIIRFIKTTPDEMFYVENPNEFFAKKYGVDDKFTSKMDCIIEGDIMLSYMDEEVKIINIKGGNIEITTEWREDDEELWVSGEGKLSLLNAFRSR